MQANDKKFSTMDKIVGAIAISTVVTLLSVVMWKFAHGDTGDSNKNSEEWSKSDKDVELAGVGTAEEADAY